MLQFPVVSTGYEFDGIRMRLLLPDQDAVRREENAGHKVNALYWAKLWPSAIALCRFIKINSTIITGRKVLELAAGLGLPGLLAAYFAREVIISDYAAEAVVLIKESAAENNLKNITCLPLDWNHLPEDLIADVVLLSDINYDPAAFEVLYDVLMRFLNTGTTIILSTPQRLMAKPFIARLIPFCIQQDEMKIELNEEQTFISLFVFKKGHQ